MSLCHDCGKTYASTTGLRRHRNSQHLRQQWHACECGKRFLDPAGASRCRRGHLKSFRCPVWECDYRSNRKDTVKEHVRRRHRNFVQLQIPTLPAGLGQPSSNASSESNLTPSQELAPVTPSIFQPQPDASHASLFHSDLSYSEPSPSPWSQYG